MRRHFRRLVAVLDGTPTGFRGQSLVEMTVTLPIFLIMLAGMVEVGWFANNYLILSDVVRTSGRFGSVRDPLLWEEGQEKNYNLLDCDLADTTYNKNRLESINEPPVSLPGFFSGEETMGDLSYYDGVACSAVNNMVPLDFKDEEDDIIVSVIAYARYPIGCDFDNSTPHNPPCTELRVSGRYPAGQNECGGGDYRDPFDVDQDGQATVPEDDTRFDVGQDGIRGYVFRGNERSGDCIGSRFDLRWIEQRLHRSLMETNQQTGESPNISDLERNYIPNFALILVEISWNSHQLLHLPLYSWIGDPVRIHVWSIFPVSAAEPDF